jgi:aspartyl-tRNA(Asn)/glutamyl-tRNA(Gln) amidotransferase subunit B
MASEGLTTAEASLKVGVSSGKLSGSELETIIRDILEREIEAVEEIRIGKDKKGKKRGFLCGLVMRETKGQADPAEVACRIDGFLQDS